MDRESQHARELLSKLDRKKKLEYFWGYYKIHVFVSIIILLFVALTVHDCATRVNPDMTIMYVGVELQEDALTQLGIDLSAYIADVNGDGKAIVSVQQVLNEQKLYVMFAAGDIQVVFIRAEEFQRYAANGAFRPLEPVLEEFGMQFDHTAYPEVVLTVEGEQAQHIYGIPLEQNAVFTQFGATMQDTYLAIVVGSVFGQSKEQAHYANSLVVVKEILKQSALIKESPPNQSVPMKRSSLK